MEPAPEVVLVGFVLVSLLGLAAVVAAFLGAAFLVAAVAAAAFLVAGFLLGAAVFVVFFFVAAAVFFVTPAAFLRETGAFSVAGGAGEGLDWICGRCGQGISRFAFSINVLSDKD